MSARGGGNAFAGEGHFACHAFADDGGDALESADVGDDGDLRFHDREGGVFGAEADVACGGEVESAADAVAVDRGDGGFAAAFDGGETVLQAKDILVERVVCFEGAAVVGGCSAE